MRCWPARASALIHSVVFGGFSPHVAEGSNSRFRLPDGDHGRRRCTWRTPGSVEEKHRRSAGALSECPHGTHRATHRSATVAMASRARRLVSRIRRSTVRRVRTRSHGRRGSAVHPVHVRLNGKAQGRAALDRRLSAAGIDHAQVRVRLSRWRRVSGARRTSAGLPATRTSSTGRSRTARSR